MLCGLFLFSRFIPVRISFFESLAENSQALTTGGAKEAEVAHFDEAFGKHMLQETVDECFGGEGAQLGLTGVRRPVAKCNPVVLQLDQAAVADGHSENIGRQVLQGCAPIANRFAVHHPILLPNPGWDSSKQGRFDQGLAELAPEDFRKCLHRQQKILPGRQPGMRNGCQAASRNQVVDMWVIGQIASPGVKNTHHADLTAHETRVFRQVLRGSRGNPKEQIVEQTLVAAHDFVQRRRQGEGQHEVRHWQEQILLRLQPFLGFVILALGAVYEESQQQYAKITKNVTELRNEALNALAHHLDGDILLINPTSFT